MTIADKAAEIKSALDNGGDKLGHEEGVEVALEYLMRRRVLAELADEDQEPGERLIRQRLRHRMLAELLDEDEGPGERLKRRLARRRMLTELFNEDEELGERLVRRAIRRRMLAELFDEDWEPGGRLMRRGLRRRMLAELFDGGPIDRLMRRRKAARAAFKPKADIFEHDGTLVIRTELPGVKKEDVEVTVDEGDLVISGERQAAHVIKDEDYYQGETMHGRFYRRLPLPAGAKREQIKADHKDGVLEIRVPMPARPKVALA